jgi:hypothetical protein
MKWASVASLASWLVAVAWLTPLQEARMILQNSAPADSSCVRHYPCDLCATNWLFVLAAGGRTGSTTALSMFNNVPDFELIGEHDGLLKTQKIMAEEMEKFSHKPQTGAWQHSKIDMQYVYCNIQVLSSIRTLPPLNID